MDKRNRIRRNAIRMSAVALMCVPLLMGSDCENSGSGSDAFSIVSLVFDVVLAILTLVL